MRLTQGLEQVRQQFIAIDGGEEIPASLPSEKEE
jgi:hypothetical protein